MFQNLAISRHEKYNRHRNQYSVIHISFNDISEECTSYKHYIGRISELLVGDLREEYPDVKMYGDRNVIDTLMDIYSRNPKARFIFVLDEWDFIFHQDFVTEEDKKAYLRFLRSLLKDRHMFLEYTMITEERFSEFFGFTESEVDEIYYYIKNNADDVRDSLALMISGISVPDKIREYAAISMHLQTRDEIFSAMVVYGFLSYEKGNVCIPNQELMEKFADMLQKESSLGYVYRRDTCSGNQL